MGAVEKSNKWRVHRLLYGSAVSRRALECRFKIPPGTRSRRDQPLRPGMHRRVRAKEIRRTKKLREVGYSWDLLDEASQTGSPQGCEPRAHEADGNQRCTRNGKTF